MFLHAFPAVFRSYPRRPEVVIREQNQQEKQEEEEINDDDVEGGDAVQAVCALEADPDGGKSIR